MYLKTIWQMSWLITKGYRLFVSMPRESRVKYSLYVQRSKQRFQNWMMMMKKMFLEDSGLKESGLEKLIKASYKLLGLISYLTAGEPEVRAWTITEGTKAPQAAGKIHSDFERGFIRAEVVSYDDLIACGSHTAAKEKGLIRLEGKDYVVKDGDIMLFRFNV